MNLSDWRERLELAGVTFDRGLRISDFTAAEAKFGIQFPDDLREYLSFAMPIGKAFPNWRDLCSESLKNAIEWPWHGIESVIRGHGYWHSGWGARPPETEKAVSLAKARVTQAPKQIPVNGHRYIPDRPMGRGNPVFSIFFSDIILYGADL
jgi:hypothetical protein